MGLPTMSAGAQVSLKSDEHIAPSYATTARLLAALRDYPGEALYGVAAFSGHPTTEDRAKLSQAGIEVLSPLQGLTYRVRVNKRAIDGEALRASPLAPQLAELDAKHRIDPDLRAGRLEKFVSRKPGATFENHVLGPGNTLRVTVLMHESVSDSDAKAVLSRYDNSPDKQGSHSWLATVPAEALSALAEEPAVRWIDGGAPNFARENNATRRAIKVDVLQHFTNGHIALDGLGGRGVQVGIFELGIDRNHPDYRSRARFAEEKIGPDAHATYIAGIVGGDGARSSSSSVCTSGPVGSPNQWRGMAPLAQLIDINRKQPFGPNGASAEVNLLYISKFGMDISNHSYGINHQGAYDINTHDRDALIRGDAVAGSERVPARLHVYSAGNTPAFFRLTKQIKNGLVVGSWPANGRHPLDPFSSRGPTQDGRIKPDVVAPGLFVCSTWCCEDDGRMYDITSGSSASSAAVTGALALVLEQYSKTYKVDLDREPPLPSTLRGMMIHAARDIRRPLNGSTEAQPTAGPDFITGWGMVDASRAVRTVSARRLIEGAIEKTCDTATYAFVVPAGRRGPLRITLAWDDVAADPALADTQPKLVNDLDLTVAGPADGANDRTYRPWQLDQKFVTSDGKEVSDGTCGNPLVVKRQFTPDNASGQSPPAAREGPDHLNNVEVVDIPGPLSPGTWTVRVSGFNVARGPQKFSLIGETFVPR